MTSSRSMTEERALRSSNYCRVAEIDTPNGPVPDMRVPFDDRTRLSGPKTRSQVMVTRPLVQLHVPLRPSECDIVPLALKAIMFLPDVIPRQDNAQVLPNNLPQPESFSTDADLLLGGAASAI